MNKFLLLMTSLFFFYSCGTNKKMTQDKQTYMQEAYLELKKEIPEAEVTILNDTVKVLFPENLLFLVGKDQVEKSNDKLLERFALTLNKYSKSRILINGYTDNSGTEQFNSILSENRARNTKNALMQYQVDGSRMFTWGRGKKDPIASNDSKEGRAKNRRVEFIILYSYNP